MSEVLAWHFTGSFLRDGRPIPPVGEWLVHDGPIEICKSGLHASELLADALLFAPGHVLHRVTMRGVEGRESDKLVARERRIDWSLDSGPVLRAFARRCALDVLPLWPDAPPVVREFLETGRDDLRAAARAATRDAARDDTWAARDAARDAARAATRDAARDDTWAAAWAAAWAFARDAAWAAKIGLYNRWLAEMVEAAHCERGVEPCPIEDGLDEPDEPLTGRARFEAERADRIDSDLSWSGDPEREVW